MKMAGVISQGICFPMSILPEGQYEIGQDVTDLIGVKQYEPEMDDPVSLKTDINNNKLNKYPAFLRRFAWFRRLVLGPKHQAGAFPSFISKTDEIRIQTAPWMLSDPTPYTFTEKIDGTSGTFALVRHKHLFRTTYEYIVCSRNRRLPVNDGSIYWQVSDKYKIKEKLMNLIGEKPWVAIQGECIGPKIQGNKYNVQEPFLYVFNLLNDWGRTPSLRAKGILECYGLDFVPIVAEKAKLPATVEEMLTLAHGESALAPILREGLVCRSVDGKNSFKAVDPEFLLKYA
jgi:RNA ligase (TIGR02306 family)